MKVFAHYMGNEKDWNLSEDGFHEEGFYDVSLSEVIELFNGKTTFVSCGNFLHIILKSLQ